MEDFQGNSEKIVQELSKKEKRKQKAHQLKEKNSIDSSSQAPNKKHWITRQQKIHKTKLRNRQSAQRSRQQRKKYIEQLEQENRQLRSDRDRIQGELERVLQAKYCGKCGGLVGGDTYTGGMGEGVGKQGLGEGMLFQHEPEEISFERVREEEPGDGMKYFLFVSLIVVSIFMFKVDSIGQTSVTPQNNQLLVNTNLPLLLPNPHSIHNSCLSEYIHMRNPFGKLRLPNLPNLQSQQPPLFNDVLFCHFPELAKFNASKNLLSGSLQILLRGHELNVKDMTKEGTTLNSPMVDIFEIEKNDLYLVEVEVKGISRYEGFRCVM